MRYFATRPAGVLGLFDFGVPLRIMLLEEC